MRPDPSKAPAPPAPAPESVSIQLDGQWVRVPKGINVVEAAKAHGRFIPHYCYHPKLEVVGNCRMCLVEIGMPRLGPDNRPVPGADGLPEISWNPRPQIGCATTVAEGMGVRTDSPLVRQCRQGVMEFLLLNHPLDCPICDQAGECRLQEFALAFGTAASRFVEDKVRKPKRVDIGKNIVLDDERCILCSRCIRFARDIAKDDALGFTGRGSFTSLAIHPDRRFDSNYSLNTVDICPVGALTSKDFRFKMRVWFLKETPSICTSCGTGCNTTIGSREGIVYRQTPRENEAVNQCWMCDFGRLNFHFLHDERRLLAPAVRSSGQERQAPWPEAIAELAARLRNLDPARIAIVASARMTNEELFLLQGLRDRLGGNAVPCDVLPRPQEADHLLVSADANPNSAGARLLGLSANGARLPEIAAGIREGRFEAVLALHEDLADLGATPESLGRIPTLAALALLPNATTGAAHFVLPGAGFAEKSGTMITLKGRLQRLNRAIPPPSDARDDWEILNALAGELGAPVFASLEAVFLAMAERHPPLAGITLAAIGPLGAQLDLAR